MAGYKRKIEDENIKTDRYIEAEFERIYDEHEQEIEDRTQELINEAEEIINKKGETKMKKTTLLDRIKGFYDKNKTEIKTVGFGALTGLVAGAATIVGAKLTLNALTKDEVIEITEVEKQPELYGEEIITEDGETVITRVVEGQ